jgi:predicted metal-dependent hydrolase
VVEPAGLPADVERAAFLRGVEQFNAGDYYGAHDTWEEIWQELHGRRATFYQALIQTAVIHVLMQNGSGAGVRAVFSQCRGLFESLPPLHRGIDLRRVLADLSVAVDWIVSRPPGAWRDVARRTAQGEAMLFDPSKAFRIELRYDPFVEPKAGDEE